ncbi:RagB/SusD family nutrient uptake outer membrane protein [uncultured Bacteroides sp.]|uniref:RagB/SusD family nutrient uptake outer membrane protein n=1 Tax=uncultured Bacteroides sp. TaxID=162156 RepID=UPI002AAB542B|nr:RagB/SusD family nutrient uptake outer membrane protein [uncultured Bacteroides sp.]
MKKHIFISLILLSFGFCSCNDWLSDPTPGVTKLRDFFTSGSTAIQSVNAAYQPMMWEYNTTYYPEWFVGDIVSDDALKGGQSIGDMADVYDMENFKTSTNNKFLLDFYRAQYQGIARCNLVLQEVPKMHTDTLMDTRLQKRLIGEVKFLRAMYYFRLVRIFGGVPKIDFVIDSSSKWKQSRATTDDIYKFITEDLEDAQKTLWRKSEYPATDLGRVTKGAAQAMLLKTYLYMHNYDKAKEWGDSIIESNAKHNEYKLVSKYRENFTLEGENGPESVFEIQYMEDPMSDYGEGNGFTRGTFSIILMRSRSSLLGGGWGFNKPTQNLYEEYEVNDPRRNETILNPTDEQIETPEQEIYLHSSRYLNKKYALMNEDGTYYKLTHATRGPINIKVIRYADVLLMYAEACCETGNLNRAKWALELVRERARQGNNNILPPFPYGNYSDNQDDLRKAIRHERRVELGMEGHRWFDLCRWGIAKEVMDAYKTTENAEVQKEMASFIKEKHELFPIPAEEINLNPMDQNPGY